MWSIASSILLTWRFWYFADRLLLEIWTDFTLSRTFSIDRTWAGRYLPTYISIYSYPCFTIFSFRYMIWNGSHILFMYLLYLLRQEVRMCYLYSLNPFHMSSNGVVSNIVDNIWLLTYWKCPAIPLALRYCKAPITVIISIVK